MTRSWSVPVLSINPPSDPAALTDLVPLVERLERAFGTRAIAQLLDVGAGTVTNWTSHRHGIGPEYSKRIIDLHDVLVRALRLFSPQVAMDWLVGTNPRLASARPIDVLVTRGAGPVIDALEGFETLGYA